MNRFSTASEEKLSPATDASTKDANDLSTIYHYPSLGRLFETPNTPALAEMRSQLERTNEALERVIRQGGRDDAERATRASRAYAATLELLNNLEQVQSEIARKQG
jgi:hypothetical protein